MRIFFYGLFKKVTHRYFFVRCYLSVVVLGSFLLFACVPISIGKFSTKNWSENPGRDTEFQRFFKTLPVTCGDLDKGLPYRIAYSQSFNQDATLWWRQLSREELVLGGNRRVAIETMGSETTLGIPESIETWLGQALRTRSPAYTQTLKSSLVAECMKIGDIQADRVINDVLRFVLDIYAQRYKFSERDIRKLQGQTFFSVRTSTYFIVRDLSSQAILGTIRAVRAPYGRRYVVRASGGNIVDDHTGDFGPIVAELLPHEAPPRQKRLEVAGAGKLEKAWAFPVEDDLGYQYNIKQGPTSLGPDAHFTYFSDRKKTVEFGDFRPLPMEIGFKVKLPREGSGTLSPKESNSELSVYYAAGEIIELGNLAIAKNAPRDVWDHLFRRLAQWVEDLSKTRQVGLWNRTLVPRLFEPLGFSTFGERFDSPASQPIYAMRAEVPHFVARVRELIDKHDSAHTESKESRQASLREVSEGLEKDLAEKQLLRAPEN